jgi:hypothetical protein
MSLSYATCAYVGCENRISYESNDVGKMRPRYCKCHMAHMKDRLERLAVESTSCLYIKKGKA